MPQTPALVLSFFLASIYAVAFHLWLGRNLRELLALWLAALIGFAAGQIVGQIWGFVPWTLGQVHILEATLLCFLFLAVARWLRQEKRTT
jgi:thiamine transporter ThiT